MINIIEKDLPMDYMNITSAAKSMFTGNENYGEF